MKIEKIIAYDAARSLGSCRDEVCSRIFFGELVASGGVEGHAARTAFLWRTSDRLCAVIGKVAA